MRELMPASFNSYVTVTLLIAVFAMNMPELRAATRKDAVISQTGQILPSVFDGLKPNLALQNEPRTQDPLRRTWKRFNLNRLPGLTPVHFIGSGSCPVGNCAGGYVIIDPNPNGCAIPSCPTNDFHTDTVNAACSDGEMDDECGDGTICCANATQCSNPRNCP